MPCGVNQTSHARSCALIFLVEREKGERGEREREKEGGRESERERGGGERGRGEREGGGR
ncbi:unnamed protein product [Spirodela intermedia]|uniref:Uncharacterized protein n=1 Tax=Spirodela intermedia TaxID=51605 RepID=A0A7I8IU37_SPIIN|nr:unnamed protein product [Spirodela intermedia]CAA6661060.1 unnamed protein product [Spirodela intermedia]